MKTYKLLSALGLVTMAFAFMSCSQTDDSIDEYKNWKARNDTYFSNIYADAQTNTDADWHIIHNFAYNDSIQNVPTGNIVVKVLTEGTGSGCPLYTDSVLVHYQGRIIPTDSVPTGKIFDSSWTGTYNLPTMSPVKFAATKAVDGFSTALQNMHIGDRWQVYIPYNLGYGASANGVIPAYSTLIFDITLVSYFRPDTTVPTTSAKQAGITGVWVTE